MQQFEEEDINQEEVNEEMEKMEELEGESEPEDEAETEETPPPVASTRAVRRPNNRGLILTIFAAIVLILVGGLASYYYYTFQSAGRESSQAVRETWGEVVDASGELLRASDGVAKYQDLASDADNGVVAAANNANRAVRDGLFDLRNQTSLDVATSTVISKLSGFLEDYGGWLLELRSVAERANDADAADALDELKRLSQEAEDSYDELLAVDDGVLKANLPRAIFDLSDNLSSKLASKLEEDKEKAEADKSNQRAAETIVSKFVQAWQDKDAEAMAGYLTSGGRNDFNPGIVEDSVDVVGLAITATEVTEDKTRARVSGNLKKRTPDGVEVAEAWRFGLVVADGAWLIDTWDPV